MYAKQLRVWPWKTAFYYYQKIKKITGTQNSSKPIRTTKKYLDRLAEKTGIIFIKRGELHSGTTYINTEGYNN